MEDFPNSENINPGEQNTINEAEQLSEMPSFEEHMKESEIDPHIDGKFSPLQSYEDLKREGNLPEGVRDENDYNEYLEEKEARKKEKENIDFTPNEIMGEPDPKLIEAVNGLNNNGLKIHVKDLVVSLLPVFFGNNKNEFWDTMIETKKTNQENLRRVGYSILYDIINSARTKDLEEHLVTMREKMVNSDGATDYLEANAWLAAIDNSSSIVGNEIDVKREFRLFCRDYQGKEYVLDKRDDTVDGAIAALWAIDIVNEDESTLMGDNNYLNHLKNSYILDKLQAIVNEEFDFGDKGYNYVFWLAKEQGRDPLDTIMWIAKQDLKRAFYESEDENSLGDVNPKILNFTWASMLKEGFENDRKAYAKYKKALEEGYLIMQKYKGES